MPREWSVPEHVKQDQMGSVPRFLLAGFIKHPERERYNRKGSPQYKNTNSFAREPEGNGARDRARGAGDEAAAIELEQPLARVVREGVGPAGVDAHYRDGAVAGAVPGTADGTQTAGVWGLEATAKVGHVARNRAPALILHRRGILEHG